MGSMFSLGEAIFKKYNERKSEEKSLIAIKENLGRLKNLDQKYWEIFMKNYPTLIDGDIQPYSDKDLYNMTIKARILLTKLGDTATKRMMYIGFNLVYPFDNPLDWYSWAIKVKSKKIPHEEYSTIALRISSEFKIMEEYIAENAWNNYNNLTESIFSSSKEKSKYANILALDKKIDY